MGITGDDLSDKDTRLAQAEVFALSEGERGGQRPAIEILKTLASLPYGDDGNLKISSRFPSSYATWALISPTSGRRMRWNCL